MIERESLELIVKRTNFLIKSMVVIGTLALTLATSAQNVDPAAPSLAPKTPISNKNLTATPAMAKPYWSELTPVQQQALKPLAMSWSTISEAQKRKWLKISKNYVTLQPADQATMHSRMNEWVTLSPQQRAQARLNFAKTNELSTQLTPDEKKAKWETYQALSPEEKEKLVAKGTPKTSGAATAVKPVSPQKLVAVPKNTLPLPAAASKPAATPATETIPGARTPAP